MVEVMRAKKFLVVALKVVTLRWWQLSRELKSTFSRVTLPGVGILVKYALSQIVIIVKYDATLKVVSGMKYDPSPAECVVTMSI